MDSESWCLIEIGKKSYRSKTRTGTGRVSRRKILEEFYIVTSFYTSASLMWLQFRCSITTGGVTCNVSDYCLEKYQSQKAMAEKNYNRFVQRTEVTKNPVNTASQTFYVIRMFDIVCDRVHASTTSLQKLAGQIIPAMAEHIKNSAASPQPLRRPFSSSDSSLRPSRS